MEQFLLIIGFAVMALIAMSQCAHHSGRCHERLDIKLSKRKQADPAAAWGHTSAGSERSQEQTPGTNADRESHAG